MKLVSERLQWYLNKIWQSDDIRKNVEKGLYNIDLIIEKEWNISNQDTHVSWNIYTSILKWDISKKTFAKVKFSQPEFIADGINMTKKSTEFYWEKLVKVEEIGESGNVNELVSKIEKMELCGKKVGLIARIHANLFLSEEGVLTLQNRNLYICTIKNVLSIAQGQAFFSKSISGVQEYITIKIKSSKLIKKYPGVLQNRMDVIIEPGVSSLVIHELCHTFEKDSLAALVGKKITNELISIKDEPFADDSWANRRFDDMGNLLSTCYVIKQGILCNVGTRFEKRRLFCESDRKRFMINTSLLSSSYDINIKDILDATRSGIILSEVVGAFNDGKNIVLRRCTFREICKGKTSDAYYISEISFKIADVFKCLVPLGKENKQVNGFCTNQYEVSYSAPFMELKHISIDNT